MSEIEFEYPKEEQVASRQKAASNSGAGTFLRVIVSAAFGLKPADLESGSRGRADIAFARQVAMYLANTRLRLSYNVIGRMFGRDRTTARHACRTVEDRREDPRVDSILDCLERAIDLWPGQTGMEDDAG